MAVAFDAQSANGADQTGGTSMSITDLTVGAGSNMAIGLVLFCGTNTAFPSGLSITRGAASFTQVTGSLSSNASLAACCAVYALLGPSSGNTTISITWTGSNEMHAQAASFSGVDQTSVAVAFPNGNNHNVTNGTTPCTVTITSAVNDMVIAGHAQNFSTWGAISGTQFGANDLTGPSIGVICNRASGAASVTMTAAFTGTGDNISTGSDIKAAAGAAAQTPYQPYFQQMLASKRKSTVGWREGYDHRWRRWRGKLLVPAGYKKAA